MKKKTRYLWIIAAILFSVTFYYDGITVMAGTEISTTQPFSTGVVDIELLEKNDAFRLVCSTDSLLPGDQVAFSPYIRNDGYDCYVRASVSIEEKGCCLKDELEGCFQGIPDGWYLNEADHRWYYRNILKHGESISLFEGFSLPAYLSQDIYEGEHFDIKIQAEAVQGIHVEPDFTDENPWEDLDVELCTWEKGYQVRQADTGKMAFKITYSGYTSELLKNTDDFFLNFPTLMPGDFFYDSILLENDSAKNLSLYFYTQAEENPILEFMQFRILSKTEDEARVIYEGDLRSKELENPCLIGDFGNEDKGELLFEVYMPDEAGNQYSLKEGLVKWFFYAEEVEAGDGFHIINSPKTGDQPTHAAKIIFLGSISFACGLIILLRMRNERREG